MPKIVRLYKSPKTNKKFRVSFENGKYVDFGADGYSDYTIHEDPMRMRSYVSRHGGKIPDETKNETNKNTVHKDMLSVSESNSENWTHKPTKESESGIYTAGFWSRWLLWSKPSLNEAKKHMSASYDIKFIAKRKK
jgi:hypothetical protein